MPNNNENENENENENNTNNNNSNNNTSNNNENNTSNNSNNSNNNENNTNNTNNNTSNNNENDDSDSEDENTVTVTNQINATNLSQVVIETTFTTNDISNNVIITEDLKQIIEVYDDEVDVNKTVINEIRNYASLIKCENFHGKGTIDDYSELFIAASKIATDNIQMNLDVDIDGFNEFGQAADDLAKLFNSFIIKLQNVNIINDSTFLNSVLDALKKIVNLSNIFGQFKENA
jgi:hypothetical protein